MIRSLIAILALTGAAWAAERPPTGLLARQGPLPATIPLQVAAPEGRDYALLLGDPGDPVLAGYLRGGEVLRLLAPPGDHALSVAAGPPDAWRGLPDLFGDGARILPDRIALRIAGDRREGQALTLSDGDGGLRITDREGRVLCQIAEWTGEARTLPTPGGLGLQIIERELSVRSRPCD